MKTRDDIVAAEAALAKAKAEVARRQSEVELSLSEEQAANVAYDTSEAESDLKKATAARVRRESKERLLAGAKVTLERADADNDRILRAHAEAECEQNRAKLERFLEVVEPYIRSIIEHEAKAAAAIDGATEALVEFMDLFDRYQRQAAALGLRVDAARPDIHSLRRMVREQLTDDRKQNGREDVSGWLQSVSVDWTEAGLTESQRIEIEAFQAKKEQVAALHRQILSAATSTSETAVGDAE